MGQRRPTKEQLEEINWIRIWKNFRYQRPNDITDPIRCWIWESNYLNVTKYANAPDKVRPQLRLYMADGKLKMVLANRAIFQLYWHTTLTDTDRLYRIDPCETDFCVSPHHFKAWSYEEYLLHRDRLIRRKIWEVDREERWRRKVRDLQTGNSILGSKLQ
jgi:hypothetical protein